MTATRAQLESFHCFAAEKLSSGRGDLSMADLLEMWEREQTVSDQGEVDLRAVQAALRDLDAGDRGIPFDQHIGELRKRFSFLTADDE